MKATMKKIQAHIDTKYGANRYEFVKANGYFYIVPPEDMIDWPESITIFALHQMDLGRWIAEVDYSIQKAERQEDDSNADHN